MPVIDMPLEELEKYQGKSPCPKDFDAFWDKSLEEMRAIDPQIEFIKADYDNPVADCYNMYFTGVGGARIHAKFLKPKNLQTPAPAMVRFHGYRCNCGEWFELLPYAACGMVVASMDCRGQGGLSNDAGQVQGDTVRGHIMRGVLDGPEKLLYRQIFLDTAQLAKIVMEMEEVDETRVGTTGGSQGGALAIACAGLESRIKLAAPVFPYLSDYRRVWEMDLCTGPYDDLREFFRCCDPLHEREDEFFETLGYIDIQNLAHRIKAKVLFSATLRDNICPPSSQFAAYNKIKSEKIMNLYYDFGHEGLRGCSDRILAFMMGL